MNTAPLLAPIMVGAAEESELISFTATATDTETPLGLTFMLDPDESPAGATIDRITGVFNWTPAEDQGGRIHRIVVLVTDAGNGTDLPLADAFAVNIDVAEINSAPNLQTIAAQTIDELQTLTVTPLFSDSDVPAQTLTFSLDSAPTGATINPTTGVITWTPTEADGGTNASFTLRVTDDGQGNLSDTETFMVTVNEVNQAPVLAAIGNRSVQETQLLTFTVTATDADLPANTLAFSLGAGAPTGATIDAATGVFNWTPTATDGGQTFNVTIIVTDNGTPALSDTETFVIAVIDSTNAPVLFTIGNRQVDEQQNLTFTASAAGGTTPLTFSLDAGAPAGATIDPLTGVFTFTPTENQGPGTFTVTVRVTDSATPALSDSETITITVGEVNLPPVLGSIGNQSVMEGQLLTFTASVTDPDIPVNTLTFSLAAGAPTGAAIDPVTGVFTWTPTSTDGGQTFDITVLVTDNGNPALADSETFTIAVIDSTNAPVMFPVGGRTVDEQTLLSFVVTAAGGTNPLTFSLEPGAPAGAAIDPATGAFTWTPTEAQGPGTFSITIRVTDSGTPTQSDTETIMVTVGEINLAPDLADIPDQSLTLGQTLTFTATATDPDLPANTLVFSLDPQSTPAGATIDSVTGAFSWMPMAGQVGTFTFIVLVNDNGAPSLADSETFTVTVTGPNQAPTMATIGNRTVGEGVALTFTATATDPELGTLTFSLAGTVPTGATIDPATGAFTWTPGEADGPGTFTFDVVVTDNGTPTAEDRETITVTVGEVNVAPVLASIADQTVTEGNLLTVDADATDSDLPAQTLVYSLTSAPTGASIDPATGVITWTPGAADGPGSVVFTVTVSDGVDSTSRNFNVTVIDANTPPTLAAIGNQTVNEGSLLTFMAMATDPEITTLTFSLAGTVPTGATIDPVTGAFTWTPGEADGPGTYTFDVVVTDSGTPAGSDRETITVTVAEVNVAPVLDAIADQMVTEGNLLTVDANATDSDLPAQTLTYSLTVAPTGATIDPATGVISWTPGASDGPGTFGFTVAVSDGTDMTTDSFDVMVNDANTPPTLNAIGNQAVDEGATLTFTASATDPDTGTLTFSLAGTVPTGAVIDPASGVFTWSPIEVDGPGTFTFDVVVTDSGTPAGSDTETITVTVAEVNVAPVVASIADQTVTEGMTLTVDADATDSDLPTQTLVYSLAVAPSRSTIDPATGVINWIPFASDGPGTFLFTVNVSDGIVSSSVSFNAMVLDSNTPPELAAIGNQMVDEGVLLTFTATATDTVIGSLTFSLEGTVPTGATIEPVTGVFTWTTTEVDGPGTYTFDVVVTDSGTPVGTDRETITVTIAELNQGPTLAAIADQAASEGVLFTLTALGIDADLPAQTLTHSLTTAPTGATIDAATGVISWTPSESDGGTTAAFTVQVSDGLLAASQSFNVMVAEVNAPPSITQIPDQTIDEGQMLAVTVMAVDNDLPAQAMTYSLAPGAPAGATIDPISGALNWMTGEPEGPALYDIVANASDGIATTQLTVHVTVNELNQIPTLTDIVDVTLDEGSLLQFTALGTDADLPTQSLVYALEPGAPTGATIDPATGAFSWLIGDVTSQQTFSITVRVTDNLNGSNTDSFQVTVNSINGAPSFLGGFDVLMPEGFAFVQTFQAYDLDAGQSVSYGLEPGAPAGMSIEPATGTITWTAAEDQGPGTYQVSLRTTDNHATFPLTGRRTMTFTITEAQSAPVLGALNNQSVEQDQTLTLTITATDSDLPANTLAFALGAGAPATATLDPATGAFSWTPTTSDAPGDYVINVQVTDNGSPALSTTGSFTVTVLPKPSPAEGNADPAWALAWAAHNASTNSTRPAPRRTSQHNVADAALLDWLGNNS